MDFDAVEAYLRDLQSRICVRLAAIDCGQDFARTSWERPEGGGGFSRVLDDGAVVEKAGVKFAHVTGARLLPAATQARPELAGRGFRALGV